MVVDTIEEDQYYGDDDLYPRTPKLEAVVVKFKPSPTPPPPIASIRQPLNNQNVSSSALRRLEKANRRKNRPTQGDWVLIREMEPNRPDIAQLASETALNSDSDSSPEDDEINEEPHDVSIGPPAFNTVEERQVSSKTGGLPTIQEVFRSAEDPKPALGHRDSVIQDDIRPDLAERRPSHAPTVNNNINGSRQNLKMGEMTAPGLPMIGANPNTSDHSRTANTNGLNHRSSISSSTSLQQLQIPQRQHADTLPAMHAPSPAGDSAVSPGQQQALPGFRAMDDIARSATSEHDPGRANSLAHRQSISSVGTSPSSIVRQLSISSHSPATPFPPFSASSPVSLRDEQNSRDIFLRNNGGNTFGADARRPSHAASDSGPYPASLHSASTNDSYHSPENASPGTQSTPIEARPRHMSLDGTLATRVLPPPPGSGIQHIPSHGTGLFRCDFSGCNAPPFQTQYLLNSHTNVHSQNRPHYCPVEGCPRGEGGKGFKRKNEMIRHGLVHQSPGYVCPFCPDREHKYPRPDNLQRHVRVHHVDKDKDDPQLRDVLAQRPEGGSRGRRRRVSDTGR